MRVFLVEVKTLGLTNVRASGDGKVHHFLLTDLPHCLVDIFQVLRNLFDPLNTAVVGNNLVFDGRVPEVELDQVSHQMLVYADEFTREDSSSVNVGGEWLKALVVAQNL